LLPPGTVPRFEPVRAWARVRRERTNGVVEAKGKVMPRTSWSDKDERQYEEIKRSSSRRGAPADRAKEIAARTVNKQRRKEGRTPNKMTQGTGKVGESYEERTKDELYNLARQRHIDGRSSMNKDQLIRALRG
jgi:hypothetical protein